MIPVLRFAPSPTGKPHIGNARAALINWLYARRVGGRLMLRIDDTDRERSTAENEAAILADLKWLGLDWDLFARQSDRMAAYEAAAETLKRSGRLYPCFESAEELELKRKLALGRGQPPIYDRAALKLPPALVQARIGAGERPTWRFKLNPGPVAWDDLIRGPVEFQGEALSDPVLVRADGQPLYTLTSVVDDLTFGISHIIRGEDHVTNTAVQIQLFQALDPAAPVPRFGHFSLIADAAGEKLSKRSGALSLEALRAEGLEPLTLVSLVARLGTADPIEPRASLQEAVEGFDLGRFGRNRPKFDPADLWALNARVLHHLPYGFVRDRLPAGATEPFWLAVRPNLTRLAEATDWWRVVSGTIEPVIEDPAFLATAAALLPAGPFDGGTWGAWTAALKAETGRKGRALFHPLRLALTGRDTGPELAALLPLIGRERVLARLALGG